MTQYSSYTQRQTTDLAPPYVNHFRLKIWKFGKNVRIFYSHNVIEHRDEKLNNKPCLESQRNLNNNITIYLVCFVSRRPTKRVIKLTWKDR